MINLHLPKGYKLTNQVEAKITENGTVYCIPVSSRNNNAKSKKKSVLVVHNLSYSGWENFQKTQKEIKNKEQSKKKMAKKGNNGKKKDKTKQKNLILVSDSGEKKKEKTSESKESIKKRSAKLFNNGNYLGSFDLLVESGMIKANYRQIAEFVYHTKNLDLVHKGSFLSSEDKISIRVLKYYLRCFDFRQKKVEMALGEFFRTFACPNESQMIDRLSQEFVKHFYRHNRELFPSSDSIYVLVMSIILLNTYFRNTAIDFSLSKKQFIKNVYRTEDGKLLSKKILKQVYKSIKKDNIFD
ncbi:guanyl-nucleotide exchange factor [Anaeramoeba flamelloides]|uniref:Guanyl-nucleotide exchange factor n=1 Tax=Anaeramoeba flamelloides TaxID=1746091 RepID=A0AAV7ZKM1_9EUKA|nr:guanyl-nucleotide exchange factor [Anaeramoeba flamelloides]